MVEIASAAGVSLLGLACIVFAVYMVFLPLAGTVAGGLRILRMYGAGRLGQTRAAPSSHSYVTDPELGLTMADGGETTGEGPETNNRKTEAKTKWRVLK